MSFEFRLSQDQVPPMSGGLTGQYLPEVTSFLNENPDLEEKIIDQMNADTTLPEGLAWTSPTDFLLCQVYPEYQKDCIAYYQAEADGVETHDFLSTQESMEELPEKAMDIELIQRALIESAQAM